MHDDVTAGALPADRSAVAPGAVRRRRLKLALRIALSLACLALLLGQVDGAAMLPLLRRLDPWWMVTALVVLTFDRVLQGAKWYPLLRVQTRRFGMREAISATIAAYPASILLPSGASEVLRAVMLGKAHGNVAEIGASVAMERVLGLLALFVANLAAVIAAYEVSHHVSDALPAAIGTVLLGFALLGILFRTADRIPFPRSTVRRALPLVRATKRFIAGLTGYRNHLATIGLVLLLSAIEVFVVGLAIWCCSNALGLALRLDMVMIATPITLFLARIPLTIWGIGIAEGGFAFVLATLYGVAPTEAVAASLTMRFVEICVALPALVLWRHVGVSVRHAASDAVGP
jgi:uncharacterized protein (TIRG00374 family)